MTSDAGSEPTDFLLTEAEERAVRENAALLSALVKLRMGDFQAVPSGRTRWRIGLATRRPAPPGAEPAVDQEAQPRARRATRERVSSEEKLLAAILGETARPGAKRQEAPAAEPEAAARAPARQRIDALTERRPAPDSLLDVSQAAAELEVSRQTVYNWLQTGKLLGWRKTKARRYIPAEQILGPGHVVPGLEDVLAEIEDPEIVWAFLTQDWPFEETTARPIALLKAGRVAEVVDAAKGYGASAT